MENEKKESKFSTSVWIYVVCFLVYSCGYIARVNYSTAVESMQTAGVMDASLAGTISAVYFISYAVGQVINGALADKKSPFVLVLIGLILIVAANLAMALASAPAVLLAVWWCVNGFGQSMLWAPIFFIMSNVLNPRLRVKAIALITLTTPVGKVSGYLLSGVSLDLGGWQGVFEMAAAVLAVMALLWVSVWLFGHKNLTTERREKLKSADGKRKANLGSLLVRSGLLIAMPALVVHGLFLNGAAEWIPTILQTSYGMDETVASYLSTIIPAVGALGVFLCHWVVNDVCHKNELKASALFMGGCIVPVAILLLLTLNKGALGIETEGVIFVVLYGALYVMQLAYSHSMVSLVSLNFTVFSLGATVSGLSNAVNYGGSALSTYAMSIAIAGMEIWQLMLVWLALLAAATLFMSLAVKRWSRFKKEVELLQNPVLTQEKND